MLKGVFKDRYGALCSVQESSYPEESCLWLGVEKDTMGEELPHGRMHLTQEQARKLAEVLLYFANEGNLGEYDPVEHLRVGSWVRGIGKENFGVYGRVIVAREGECLTVQDQNTPGTRGHIHCVWELVAQMWVPDEPPSEGVHWLRQLEEDGV